MEYLRSALIPISFLAFILSGCASGSAILTGITRPAIAPEKVQLYLESPTDFEVIGLVSASSDAGLTEQGDVNYAVKELKRQAAKLGANGILLTSTGDQINVTTTWSSTGKTITGKAIFVKNE